MAQSRTRPGRARSAGRISPRGQVTVPKPVRDHLGLGPGSTVEFVVSDGGAVVLRKQADPSGSLRGSLGPFARPAALSLADLDTGVAREVARLDAATRADGGA